MPRGTTVRRVSIDLLSVSGNEAVRRRPGDGPHPPRASTWLRTQPSQSRAARFSDATAHARIRLVLLQSVRRPTSVSACHAEGSASVRADEAAAESSIQPPRKLTRGGRLDPPRAVPACNRRLARRRGEATTGQRTRLRSHYAWPAE